MKMIPNCFFPTTIVLVDDEDKYLKILSSSLLSSMNVAVKTFKNPIDALKFLNEEYIPCPFNDRCIKSVQSYEYEHEVFDISINELYKEVYNPNRFHQISTIVVDYNMPGINGLTFCEQIKLPHVQKILLTGVADENLAVKGFNDQLIHQFLFKQGHKPLDQLNETLLKRQTAYFCELSSVISHSLHTKENRKTAIYDPAFISVFKELIKKYNITEYYQFENTGSFFMLDKNGKDYALFTLEQSQVEADIEKMANANLPTSVFAQVRNHQKVFCYHREGHTPIPSVTEWEEHLLPAKKIEGKDLYYYAFIPEYMDIDPGKILSFHDFIENTQ